MSETHFIGVPSIALLKTYANKKYPTIYAALEEYIDNSLDAIERAYFNATEEEIVGNIRISLSGDKILVADNAEGMNEEQLQTALTLGDSGTDKSGHDKTLGTFGCGASSAASTIGETLNFLTKTTGGELLFGAFDPKYIEKQGQWAYPLRRATNLELEEFNSIVGEDTESGTIAIVNGLAQPPKKKSSFYDTLKKKILTRYSHRFLSLKEAGKEVHFDFIGGDTRNFEATENIVDVLCDEVQSKTKFFDGFGGPNNEVSWKKVLGFDIGVRASFTKDYDQQLDTKHDKDNNSATNNYWGYGIHANQKQGIYFYRNGKLLETRTGEPLWRYHGSIRGLLVEIHITDEMIDNKLVKIAQEKTSVVLNDTLITELQKLFKPIVSLVRSNNEKTSNGKIELTDEQEKQKAENTIEGISRALKSQRKKSEAMQNPSQIRGIIDQVTTRQNSKYVGSGEKVEVSTSKNKQSDFGYKWVNELRSKATPFWIEYLSPESEDGKLSTAKTIVLNEAHPLMKELKDEGQTRFALIFAASTAYGMDKDSDFSTEKFEEIAQGIGEIALQIMDSVSRVEQMQEKRLKASA